MNVLVLGLNPSGKGGIKSRSIQNLYRWMTELGIQHFSFCNIYDKPGYFHANAVNHAYIRKITFEADKILALGVKVSIVLDLMGIDHFRLPHPSGLNRRLNDQKYVNVQLNLCKNYVYELPRSGHILSGLQGTDHPKNRDH